MSSPQLTPNHAARLLQAATGAEAAPLQDGAWWEAPAEAEAARRFARYEILEEIARGGMGVVYKARQLDAERLVALKVILPHHLATPGMVERFRAEAEAAASLDHPAILPIYEVGEWAGQPFFSMKLAVGGPVHALGEPWAPRAAAELMAQVAEAVAHAHRRGILHRDLKPGNILLGDQGEPFVADFGLAKWLGRASDLTQSQALLGTPNYLAPEQASGAATVSTTAVDLHALGAVLYELLAGRPAFAGASVVETLQRVAEEAPAPLPEVPRDLEMICRKCLEKNPAHRYADVAALAADLRRFLAGETVLARPVPVAVQGVRWARRHPAAAALVALILLGAVAAVVVAFALARSRERALQAESIARERLWESQLARAEALRGSKRPGQKFAALAPLAQAAKERVTPALRDAAIATLAQLDVQLERRWQARGAEDGIFAMAPDFQSYVAESAPGVLAWRDLATDRQLSELRIPGGVMLLSCPRFSPGVKHLLVRHADDTVGLWTLADGKMLAHLNVSPPAPGRIRDFPNDLDWHASGSEVAIGLREGGLAIFDQAGRERRRLDWPGRVHAIRYQPAGGLLAVVYTNESRVLLFAHDPVKTPGASASFELQADIATPQPARCLEWSPDGQRLAVGMEDGGLALIEVAKKNVVKELAGHRLAVRQVVFSPDGRWLVSEGRDITPRVWEARGGELVLAGNGLALTPPLSFSPEGRRLAGRGLTNEAHAAAIFAFSPSAVVREHPPVRARDGGGLIAPLDFSRDGRWLVTASRRGVDLREASDGRIVRTLFEPEEAREECTALFVPAEDAVYVSSRVKGTLRYPLAADAGEPVVFDAEPGFLLAGQGGGRFVLTHRADGRVKVVDERGRVVTSIAPHPQAFAAALSSDGRWLATQVTGVGPSSALSARLWSLPGGALERTIDCGPTGVVAFSEGGAWLAVSGRKGVELLRGANGRSATANWPESVRRQGKLLSFTADGSLLAVEVNEAVVLLRPATGEVLATLRSPSGEASFARVRLSPDGRRLAMMWDNAAVDVWQLDVLRRELGALGLDW